jgi:uncharacterized protein (TIGR00725 family)
MRKPIVGVMGAGEEATQQDLRQALKLGELIARQGWILLSGGRSTGVMQEVNRGAKQVAGSLTIGILPQASAAVSEFVDVAIITDLGQARNNINVLSSHVVVACGAGGAGTASEIALAIKADQPVILLGNDESSKTFFQRLSRDKIFIAETPEQVIQIILDNRLFRNV